MPSAYDLFAAIAAVVSIGVISWQMTLPEHGEISRLLQIFDYAFCAFFLIDYLRHLIIEEHRVKYALTWGLFDLGSAIPAIGPLRYARIARLLRIIRMIRGIRMLAQVYRRDRTAFTVAIMMAIGLAIIIGVTAAVLHVEHVADGASIKTGEDAAWWAVVTVSTVGYGDYTPITPIGRTLAVILMVTGIGLFATFAGAITNVFMRQMSQLPSKSADTIDDRIARLEAMHHKLHDAVHRLHEKSRD